jgi:hypothetical protein
MERNRLTPVAAKMNRHPFVIPAPIGSEGPDRDQAGIHAPHNKRARAAGASRDVPRGAIDDLADALIIRPESKLADAWVPA